MGRGAWGVGRGAWSVGRGAWGVGTHLAVETWVPRIAAGLLQFLRMSTERGEVISAMPILNYRDLEAWQAAFDLCLLIYDVAADLPGFERYELAGQLRRAGVSVPSTLPRGTLAVSPRSF